MFLLIHSPIDSDKDSSMALAFPCQRAQFQCAFLTFVAFVIYLKIHPSPINLYSFLLTTTLASGHVLSVGLLQHVVPMHIRSSA